MNETMSRRHALRTASVTELGIGLMAAAGARSEPVAAEPLSPADELVAVLRRAESLMRNELRHDDEARSVVSHMADWLWRMAEAADPQQVMTVDRTWDLVQAERPAIFA